MVHTTYPRTSDLARTWNAPNASPFSLLRNDLDRFFDDFWRRNGVAAFGVPSYGASNFPTTGDASTGFFPSLDVSETVEGYRVTADLPGLRREDVSIYAEGNALVIAGSRIESTTEQGRNYLCRECVNGEFKRVVNLEDVELEKAHASMNNGVLNIEIPKTASSARKRRTISIETSGSTTSSSGHAPRRS